MSDHISAFPSAWVARYANIPVWPGKSSLPEDDGDMAYLRHTAEEVHNSLRGIFTDRPRRVMVPPSNDWHYRNTIGAKDINPTQLLRYWPADVAGEQIAEWKAQLVRNWTAQR